MEYYNGCNKESWYLDKIENIDRKVVWQSMPLLNLQINISFSTCIIVLSLFFSFFTLF